MPANTVNLTLNNARSRSSHQSNLIISHQTFHNSRILSSQGPFPNGIYSQRQLLMLKLSPASKCSRLDTKTSPPQHIITHVPKTPSQRFCGLIVQIQIHIITKVILEQIPKTISYSLRISPFNANLDLEFHPKYHSLSSYSQLLTYREQFIKASC